LVEQPTSSRTARLILSPEIVDSRGALMFVEGERLPFRVERIFAMYAMSDATVRGGHAHRAQHQLVIMAHGTCRVLVDNGETRTEFSLERPNQALHIPPMVWLELSSFAQESSCFVLASGKYDELDYIRHRSEFERLARRQA
jgi:hypothetical protein